MADCACNNFPASLGNVTFGANVGIGTGSPAVRLHVEAPGGVEIGRFVAAGSGDAFIQAWAGSSQAYLFANRDSYGGVGSLSSNAFAIRTGNTDRVYIEAGGRVGVGTTTPGAKLDVAGDILVSATSPENPLHSGLQRVGSDTILWYGGGTGSLQIKAGQGGPPGNRVTITPSGNVGVGTSGPDGLQVNVPVVEAAQGVDNVRLGVAGGTPRLVLEDGGTLWEIDNDAGKLRLFQPGVERLAVTNAGDVYVGGRLAIDNQGRSTYAP